MRPSPADRWPRSFGWFWAGDAASGFSGWITLLALQALVVVTLDAGTTGTGLLNAARWLPYLLFGLVVGALLDRLARRPVMVVTDAARGALLLLIPLAWWAGVFSLPLLLVIVFAFGTATLMNDSASQAFLPRFVPRPLLQPAHARIDGTDAVAETAGPASAGALLGLFGAPFVILLNTVTFVFSAVVVALIRVAEPRPERTARPRLGREIRAGLVWVYRTPDLRALAVWTHVWFAGQGALGAVLAVYLLTAQDLSYLWFGLVTAAAGVGGLGGAVASGPLGRRWGSGSVVVGCHVLSAVGVLGLLGAQVVPWEPAAVAVLCCGQAAHGFAMGASNSHEMAYRQSVTPDAFQVRVNTTMRSVNRAVIVVVAPTAGLLATWVGLTPVLVAAAALFALAAVGLWRSPFRHATLPADA